MPRKLCTKIFVSDSNEREDLIAKIKAIVPKDGLSALSLVHSFRLSHFIYQNANY